MSKPKANTTHRWLLLLPFIWQIGFAPIVNGIADRPFSLPFPMFWQMVGIVFTSVVIAIVFWLEGPSDEREIDGDEDADYYGGGLGNSLQNFRDRASSADTSPDD